jgi:hypothetical protein
MVLRGPDLFQAHSDKGQTSCLPTLIYLPSIPESFILKSSDSQTMYLVEINQNYIYMCVILVALAMASSFVEQGA